MRMFFFVLLMLTANVTTGDIVVGHPSVTAKLAIKKLEAKQFIDDSEREETCLNLFSENEWLMEYRGISYSRDRYSGYVAEPESELSSPQTISLQRARNYDCFAFLSNQSGSGVSATIQNAIIVVE